MSAYASEYPSVEFDAAYKKFFEEFYATSDTPDAHEKYIENFTQDATLIMASKKAQGSDGMICGISAVQSHWLISIRDSCAAERHVGKGCQQKAQSHQDLPLWP